VGKLEGIVNLRAPRKCQSEIKTGGVIEDVAQKYVLVLIFKYYLCKKVL